MVIRIDEIVYTSKFEHEGKKIKDKRVKDRLEKSIRKIVENPEIGKPLSYVLKGEDFSLFLWNYDYPYFVS